MRQFLCTRRKFLQQAAGSPLSVLWALPSLAADNVSPVDLDAGKIWAILDAVQQRLLPSELGSPGAKDIRALAYLRFVVSDPKVDADIRAFIPQGATWIEGLAQHLTKRPFLALDAQGREQILQRVADSQVGEHWLSILITYLMEALLADPIYGGNPNGVGWHWLQHTPGHPRPSPDKIYPKLDGIVKLQ